MQDVSPSILSNDSIQLSSRRTQGTSAHLEALQDTCMRTAAGKPELNLAKLNPNPSRPSTLNRGLHLHRPTGRGGTEDI